MERLRSGMPTYVALSAVILSLMATASAQRLHPRALLSDLDVGRAPLPGNSGFRTAAHRRALKTASSDVQQKVVAALKASTVAGSNPQSSAQALVDAAHKADGELQQMSLLHSA
jgi:hypothetical protein